MQAQTQNFFYVKAGPATFYFTDLSRKSIIEAGLKTIHKNLPTVKNAEQFNANTAIQQVLANVPELTLQYQQNLQRNLVFTHTPISYTKI